MLPKVFQSFIEHSPICVMARAVWKSCFSRNGWMPCLSAPPNDNTSVSCSSRPSSSCCRRWSWGRRLFQGDGPTGKIYEQTLALTYGKQTGELRRVTIELLKATRDGDTSLHLLTNLPKQVSALQVADLYRRRWTIETLFLEVTTTLTCEIRTLCYPKAALFVFCLALVAANAVAVLKAALRAAHGEEPADALSGYYLALEVKQVHEGMMIALPPGCWEEVAGSEVRGFAKLLKEMAAHVDLERYRKSIRGPKKPPPKKSRYQNGGHVSTHKLLTADGN